MPSDPPWAEAVSGTDQMVNALFPDFCARPAGASLSTTTLKPPPTSAAPRRHATAAKRWRGREAPTRNLTAFAAGDGTQQPEIGGGKRVGLAQLPKRDVLRRPLANTADGA